MLIILPKTSNEACAKRSGVVISPDLHHSVITITQEPKRWLSTKPPRHSRHYYDLARMAVAPVKNAALANLELLADVVAFKQRFYPRGWARYDLAVPSSLRLVPGRAVLAAVETDYRAMANMIFGAVPAFGEIIEALRVLEEEINARC